MRVGVTRPRASAAALADRLTGVGFEPVLVPMVEQQVCENGMTGLVSALADVAEGTWLVVTSPFGATTAVEALRRAEVAADSVRIAAVGPSTAARFRGEGWEVDLVPPVFSGASLGSALAVGEVGRALLAVSAIASTTVEDELRAAGWTVDRHEVYATAPVSVTAADLRSIASVDVLTFTSGSAAVALADVGGDGHDWPPCVCLGTATAEAAAAAGFDVVAVADPSTLDGLVAATARWHDDHP